MHLHGRRSLLGSEQLQAVLLVQVPAPELLVVLVVRVVPVHGRGVLRDELLRGAEHDVVARAQERRHRHPLPVRVHHRPVPHTPVLPVAQRLHHQNSEPPVFQSVMSMF